MDNALASTTRKSYQNSVELFKSFCRSLNRKSKKVFRDDSIELWLTYLDRNSISYGRIRSHMSALRHFCTRRRISENMDTPQVKLILRGIRKKAKPRTKAAVVNVNHLKRLVTASKKFHSGKEHTKFAAMVSLAFYGFLRPSEYCKTSTGHALLWKNARFSKRFSKVRLQLNSFKHSQEARIVQVESQIICCPVNYLREYRAMFKSSHGSLLFDVTAKEFRNSLQSMCRVAKIKSRLTPHALRHGGASWAGKQGWPFGKSFVF